MDIKKVASAMQDIEFVLFTLQSNGTLQPEELENAHKKSREIIEKYLLPLGAFED